MRRVIVLIIIATLVGATFWISHLPDDPRVVLLRSEDGAQWMRPNRPLDLAANFTATSVVAYESPLPIPARSAPITVQIAALRRAILSVDGNPFFDTGTDLRRWKTIYSVPLPTGLSVGQHRLRLLVLNDGGPALVRINCPALGLRSGDGWIASDDGKTWRPAIPIDRPWEISSGPSAAEGVVRYSPLLILLFILGSVPLLRRSAVPSANKKILLDWGRWIRWTLLLAWVALASNNLMKVPLRIGYDIHAQYQYILYVAEHLALPKPDAGWQYFQSPLYYILSAALWRLVGVIGITGDAAACVLRVIPLACGMALVELSYRAARSLFPGRGDLHAVAATVGGLLPVNLYLSQTVSNEPMAAAVSGLIFLLILRFITRPAAVRSTRDLLLTGVLLGTAWLTKVSTVLWVLPVMIILFRALAHERCRPIESGRAIGLVLVGGIFVSAWYFVWNILRTGKPFELSSANVPWWQDPGYRIPENFWEFGHAFASPTYNGLRSAWDSLYATMWSNGIPSGGNPPWNFGLMSCVLWLSVLPTLSIFAGIGRSLFSPGEAPNVRAALQISGVAVVVFIGAIVYVYLTLPIYSSAKASYMLGTAPCLGLLAAAGFDLLSRHRVMRATAGGLLFAWAVTGYFTYFVF